LEWGPDSADITGRQISQDRCAESIIRQAYEKGIRFFDCADSYGTHPFTAAALKGVPRESYTLSSKIWVAPGGYSETERPDADVVIDRFRKELRQTISTCCRSIV